MRVIQPGIESLSTKILKLMRKGVTALQNIALLKWCAVYGIRVNWNIIVGTPGEDVNDYDEMADLVGALTHLQPPDICFLSLDRFSPYYENPDKWDIKIVGPRKYYRELYPAVEEATLMDLAYSFEFTYGDGRDPLLYSEGLRGAVEAWRNGFTSSGGQLRYFCGPDFVRIRDYRGNELCEYVLTGDEASVFLRCDEVATVEEAHHSLGVRARDGMNERQIERFLDEMVERKLMYHEDGRYLGLALPYRPRRGGDSRGRSPVTGQ